MAKKKAVHKSFIPASERRTAMPSVPSAEESAEVKGLKITLDSLVKSGFKKDSKEVKAIEKLIEQHK